MRSTLAFVDYSNAKTLGSRLRAKRAARIRSLIDAIFERKNRVRIVDLGGRESYWRVFGDEYLGSRNVEITLVNLEIFEPVATSRMVFHQGDATCLPEFRDASFDLVHSNSTIEHVGRWEQVEAFAREASRLAPSYYVQTPYFWFPIEPHAMFPVLHWFPESWRAKLMMKMTLGNYSRAGNMGKAMRNVQDACMLDRAQMRYLFPDSSLQVEWIGCFPKSLMAIRDSSRSEMQ